MSVVPTVMVIGSVEPVEVDPEFEPASVEDDEAQPDRASTVALKAATETRSF